MTGQTNRKGRFFHCIDRSFTRTRLRNENRIVGLTDELRGKIGVLSFQLAFLESHNSIQSGFGKLSGRGLVRSAPPAA
jgi:hypothetical protein